MSSTADDVHGDPDLDHPNRAALGRLLRDSPLLATLGLVLEDWGVGHATTILHPGPQHGNIGSSVHGGVLFALADAAFEAACNGAGRCSVALETSGHNVSPAPLTAPLRADAVEVHRTRRTASYRIEVRDAGDDALRAWYMALAYRTSDWHLGVDAWPDAWRARF